MYFDNEDGATVLAAARMLITTAQRHGDTAAHRLVDALAEHGNNGMMAGGDGISDLANMSYDSNDVRRIVIPDDSFQDSCKNQSLTWNGTDWVYHSEWDSGDELGAKVAFLSL